MSPTHGLPVQHEALGAADEVNLLLDRGDSVYVVTVAGSLGAGGFVRADGSCDVDAVREMLAERIGRVPRLCRRIEGGPRRHRLVETTVDLRAHVRVVEPVDGFTGFERLCARLSATRLPRDRPLWELLFVPNTDRAQPLGWVFRVHHALADGMTAARMLDALFDPEGEDATISTPTPTPTPGKPGKAATPPRRRGCWGGLLRALTRPLPGTVLLGSLGPGRGLRFFDVPLTGLAGRARHAGVTINDAVLAVVAAGARAAYASLRESVPAELPISVPVLLPSSDGLPNQVSAVVIPVPLDEAGIVERAQAVAATAHSVLDQTRARRLPWFARTRSGARVMQWFMARQRMIGLISTNMRGPARSRRLCGAPVEAAWALSVLGGNVRIAVAALSYAGTMSFCVLWSDEVGDAGPAFADGMRSAVGELLSGTRSPTL